MADELKVTATLEYADSDGADEVLSLLEAALTVTTKKYTKAKQSIGTVEEAVNLGEVTSLGYALFINRDTTNFIELRVATAGTKFVKLWPRKCALFYFGSGITAPFAIADTAACLMESLIVSA